MLRLLLWAVTLPLLAVLTLVLTIEVVDVALTSPAIQADVLQVARREPALAALQSNDAAHYGAHVFAGTILSLCPCTRDLAAQQYGKATWHARTRYQWELVTTDRPHSAWDVVGQALRLSAGGLRWVGSRLV